MSLFATAATPERILAVDTVFGGPIFSPATSHAGGRVGLCNCCVPRASSGVPHRAGGSWQAYLRGIAPLPVPDLGGLTPVLPDVDLIIASNDIIGQRKTRKTRKKREKREMAAWAAAVTLSRSFSSGSLQPTSSASRRSRRRPVRSRQRSGRRALDQVGFDLVVEAGLGRGHRDSRTMRLHLLPRALADGRYLEGNCRLPRSSPKGVLDRRGMALLTGKAGRAVRRLCGRLPRCRRCFACVHGGELHGLIDLDPLSPRSPGLVMYALLARDHVTHARCRHETEAVGEQPGWKRRRNARNARK